MKHSAYVHLNDLCLYDAETGIIRWVDAPHRGLFDNVSLYRRYLTQRAGKRAFNSRHSKGYLVGTYRGRQLYAHRVAWCLAYCEIPAQTIDHINGDKSDNRLFHLRCVSSKENSRNLPIPKSNTSGAIGVISDGQSWRAQIGFDGEHLVLGRYKTFEEAVAARRSAEIVLGFHKNHGRPINV